MTRESQLRQLRRARGLTLDRLARQAGVQLNTVWKLERGQRPSFETAVRLARALGVPVETVFPEHCR